MNNQKLPFNIILISPESKRLAGLLAVQNMDIFGTDGEFHPLGLYSSQIFGKPNNSDRMNRPAFIDMRADIMHPKIYMELRRLKGLYGQIIAGSTYATWNDTLKDFVKGDILDGCTGYAFFLSHFKDIVFPRNDSKTRDLRVDFIEKYRNACMYRYLTVLPAGMRDVEITDGRTTENPINALYRKVLRSSNTISVYTNDKNSSALDSVRWQQHKGFGEIYDHIDTIMSGKTGFLQEKYSKRGIANGTRNVITAMDSAYRHLDDDSSVGTNDTMCGLHQYMKGTLELSIFDIKHGPMEPIISKIPGSISVVDPSTLMSKVVHPSRFTIEKWGGDLAIEDLISGYGKLEARHKPVMIDNGYAALIYKDNKNFKVLYDISDLPDGFDKKNVSPMTWTDMFYLSVYLSSRNKSAAMVTRYPITGTASIIPTLIYLRTTLTSASLIPLDDSWQPMGKEYEAYNVPILDAPHFDSMSIHPSRAAGMGADYDGDKCSLNFVYCFKESVDEIKNYFDTPQAYLNPNGGLQFGITDHLQELVLYNFTRGLQQ